MSLMVRNTTSIPVKQSFKIPGGKLIKKGLSTVGKKAGKLASTGLNLVTFGGFGIARNIVKKLGITKFRVITQNPNQKPLVAGYGVEITEMVQM